MSRKTKTPKVSVYQIGVDFASDVATIMNIHKEKAHPSELITALVDALAWSIVYGTEPAATLAVGRETANILAQRILFHRDDNKMESASPHQAGHA